MTHPRLAALVTAAALFFAGCSLAPAVAELGPVSASNGSGQTVVVKLETQDASWTISAGQRANLLASRTSAIGHAYLVSPTTCEIIDTADLNVIGNVHLTIGVGPKFTSVEGVDQPDRAPEIRPTSSDCPGMPGQ
jgi:hypothetical protein